MPGERAGTYLTTSITYERRPIFRAPQTAELFLETLQHYRHAGHYKLHAFVVMPDHVHLLITPQAITLERAMQLIKGGFSHQLKSKLPVWQKGFNDHRCRDADDFIARKNYIHQNPVRAHLVIEPWQYRFSSAYRADQALSG